MGASGSQFLRCSKCCVVLNISLRERCKEVVRRGGERLPKKMFSEAFDGIGAFFVIFVCMRQTIHATLLASTVKTSKRWKSLEGLEERFVC